MKILVIGRYFYPQLGGGEIALKQIFSALAKKGHKIYVVTSRLENGPAYEEIDGLEIYRPYSGGSSFKEAVLFSLRLTSYLKDFLKLHPVDVIFGIAYSSTLPASYAARKGGVPLVTHVGYFFDKTWFLLTNPFLAFFNWVIPGIVLRFGGHNIICCPSNEVSRKLQGYTKAEVIAIPNGLDTDEISYIRASSAIKDMRTELGITDGERLLLFVGRLSPEKNLSGLIKTLHGLDINFKLAVVGDGPQRDRLENLTQKLKLERQVIFLGYKSHRETLAIMKSCDVLILPSKTEVFPMVVLEALALGRPVIATRVGGIAEVKSTNLHLINSIAEIREILPQIKPEPDGDLLEHYSLDKVCSQYEAMFRKLV